MVTTALDVQREHIRSDFGFRRRSEPVLDDLLIEIQLKYQFSLSKQIQISIYIIHIGCVHCHRFLV